MLNRLATKTNTQVAKRHLLASTFHKQEAAKLSLRSIHSFSRLGATQIADQSLIQFSQRSFAKKT